MRQSIIFCLGCFFYAHIAMAFTLTSSAFHNGNKIPFNHTCDGADTAPDLHWIDPPVGTKSFALIVDDPDAPSGIWTHWVVFNLSGDLQQWTQEEAAAGKAIQGYNSWHQLGYRGPCPPNGEHRYFFYLYALDRLLDLPKTTDVAQLRAAMIQHVLGQAVLMGRYSKS